jgi:hypothetical protein
MELIHVFSEFKSSNPDTDRRMLLARETWCTQQWHDFPIKNSELNRVFTENAQELPYIKDLLNLAVNHAKADEIIVFTNSDICVAPDCASRIYRWIEDDRDACYAFRNDFPRLTKPLTYPEIKSGHKYCGADLFAFKARWWMQNCSNFPDLILGREAWDACMRVLMETTKPDKSKSLALPDLIYHEKHPNGWENASIRYRLPGQIHNLRHAYQWLRHMKHNPANFGVRQV